MTKLRVYYRIEDGELAGTILEPIMATVGVQYPHRKTKDLYVPPMEDKNGKKHGWHCCQPNCSNPDMGESIDELIEHLKLHAGRLIQSKRSVRK